MNAENPDLKAPPAALAAIARGIDLAHAELRDLGMIGEATTGRGFSELSLSGLDLGHGGLADAFGTFCDRWEWGVRALTLKGNGFALAVGLSAGSFAEQEQYVKDSIKIGVNSLNGNPHLGEDEVRGMSWDEVSTRSATDDPDWSAESFSDAHREAGQAWRDTGYDVADAQMDAFERRGLIDPGAREAADARLREALDPSEETIAQAEEPRWGERG
ncbi:hypothetical protein SSP531S_54840 [Streptomyces spongiicola]|uniref:Uncharacterized protein n=1 Tax=Streptomyces spongiicola TaxID=1690221 RepID=A0A2S1Z014_9ACTN|nr:hypothetical protein [Streptomyces spongiicola]AWK09666.1 hypothetical protein DDQ41_12875 [Streptomyces spongiicola]GBQ03994.1 hypothetical protein SSP531S_54840 [Streptomyces spongiicola]